MFDTMTMTKIAGGLFTAWLILLLGKWAGEEIYHAEAHGEPSYVIEVASSGGDEPEEEVDMLALLASADVGSGERIFRKCTACHKLEDGANGTGPHLYGVVDRDIAAVADYAYSDVLLGKDGAWTAQELGAFLANPKSYAPGNKMGFAGLKKVEERADVIAYLATIGG